MSSERTVHSLRTLSPQPLPPSSGTPPRGTARQETATLTTYRGLIPSDQRPKAVGYSPPSRIDSRGLTLSAAARTSPSRTGLQGSTPLTVPRTLVAIAVGSLPLMTLTPSGLLDPLRSPPPPRLQRRVQTIGVLSDAVIIKQVAVRADILWSHLTRLRFLPCSGSSMLYRVLAV